MNKNKSTKTTGEWLLLVGAGGIFVCGIILSFQGKTANALATYGAAVLCLIFSSLSMFQSFKGLGVEAVLKDKIEEADKLIEQLRSFILPTSRLLISNIARSGRWDSGLPRKIKYDLCDKLTKNMKEVGIAEKDIELSKKDWYRFNLFDLASPVFKDVGQLVKPIEDDLQSQMRTIPQPISAQDRDEHDRIIHSQHEVDQWIKSFRNLSQQENLFALAEEIRQHLHNCTFIESAKKNSFLTEHRDVLEDLEFYSNNKEFRRLDVWFSGYEE